MAEITFKSTPVHTSGNLPQPGSKAPDFLLTDNNLKDYSLADLGKGRKVLNIVPSLDTGVCATSAKRFEQEITNFPEVKLITVSCDLPFAQKRFCTEASLSQGITLSQMRNKDFGKVYGVEMTDGPLKGIFSRAVVIIDENNIITYTEQVPEITREPDYQKALAAL
ncbi:thiol peroxidase [Spirochaeta dissipatitropha]